MKNILIILAFLFPISLSAQLLRSYGVVEIGATFPTSSVTGAKFAYRTVDSSYYRWVSGNTWVKIIEPSIISDTLYLTEEIGTSYKVSGDTINLTPYLLKSDTTVMLVKYIERGDTASMLSNYPTFGDVNTSLSNYLPILGGTLTGTGGAGFIGFPSQVSAPGTPASGLNVYAQGSSFNWKGTDGYERLFASTLTGGRTYTLPDVSGTFALGTGTAARSARWSATNTLAAGNFTDNGTKLQALLPFQLQQWTTAGRPTGVDGYLGWNTSFNWFDTYSSSGWFSPARAATTGGAFTAGYIPFGGTGGLTENADFTFTPGSVARVTINSSNNVGFGLNNAGANKWVIASYLYNPGNYDFSFYNNQTTRASLVIDGNTDNLIAAQGVQTTTTLAVGTSATIGTTLIAGNNITVNNASQANMILSKGGNDFAHAAYQQDSGNDDYTIYAYARNVYGLFLSGDADKAGIYTRTPDYNLDVNGVLGIDIPRGTVAQRPTIASNTTPLRFSTDSTALEYGESVGVWRLLATREYARSLVSVLPTTNIYTANGSLSGNRTITSGGFDLRYTGNFSVGSSSAPARTLDVTGEARISDLTTDAPTRILGADADGDLGELGIAGGLSISGGVLTGQNIGNTDLILNGYRFLDGDGNGMNWFDLDDLSIQTNSTGSPEIYLGYGQTSLAGGSTNNRANLIINHSGQQFDLLLNQNKSAGGISYVRFDSTQFTIRESLSSLGNFEHFKINTTGVNSSNSIVLYEKYTLSNSTPGTGSNVHVWDNGTPSFKEVKRDTTIFLTADTDYNFSAAITTAQIASRYNRIIIHMTLTSGASADKTTTLHTPDANLMQCEILIRGTDNTVSYDNEIAFGTNNAISSDGTNTSGYTLAQGQGLHVRVVYNGSAYKYIYY